MDVMELRRRMLKAMASGAYFESGTFTPTSDNYYQYLDFNKTINRFLLFIEATEESKEDILDSGINAMRTYAYLGIYPRLTIGEATETYNACAFRVNPTTKATNQTYTTYDSNGFQCWKRAQSISDAGTTDLIVGVTYKYFIVEIED